jgi:diguanylate cyclase (GGDEF)-like protein
MEELLLWRWSTSAQIVSVLMVTGLLVILRRSSRRRGLGLWAAAWVANAGAMLATLVYWFGMPPPLVERGVTGVYVFSKTLFVLLLVLGTARVARPALRLPRIGTLVGASAAIGVAVMLAADTIDGVGIAQASLIAAVLLPAAVWCARLREQGLGWLGIGFALRGLLGLLEALAYGLRLVDADVASSAPVDFFLGAHSLFDMGAEWAIAVGIVLALAQRAIGELRRGHAELEAAHRRLREVADTDPLTGLANRRLLPTLYARFEAAPAWLVFIDLDDFKRINDADGHAAGDGCLRRFAEAVSAAFGAGAACVRFGGDEFVVLLPGGPRAPVDAAVAALRQSAAATHDDLPGLRFSAGVAEVPPGTPLDAALALADAAMYREKSARRR